MSAGSAQLLDEGRRPGGGLSHTQSVLPLSARVCRLPRPFKFEFQRPGRRACARGGRGPAAFVPAPEPGHVTRRPELGPVPSCRPPPLPSWVGTLLPLNCLGRAPAATHAPTHALAGPFAVQSAPAAPPSSSAGVTSPVRVPLVLGPNVICLPLPEEALDCKLDPSERPV